MELNQLYFYTATIVVWKQLLSQNNYKEIVISSLQYLVNHKKIKVYGFVIMPNHIHLVWELLELNGKELPHASFMKFTGNEFLKHIKNTDVLLLDQFEVESSTRIHQFWQRDSLPIHLYSPEVIYQKLDYIHRNPVQEKWKLSNEPSLYLYSSANFYETGIDNFHILTHIGERIRS